MTNGFSHLDDEGQAHMVDVGHKSVTYRSATARARVVMQIETLQAIRECDVSKGDVLQVARLAGIMASKQTANLIPLCHPLGIDSVDIEFETAEGAETADGDSENGLGSVTVVATVSVHAKTGVEMEALTAASVAALTIYDMCKSRDRGMTISEVCLLEKLGGKSGHFVRKENGAG